MSATDLDAFSGILLDVGCGANKLPGHHGMDRQKLEGVDTVHDWNDLPWPFPDECALQVMAVHVIEHVSPINGFFLEWMDEVWRILKPGGRFGIVVPYATSFGYFQDPTHCNPCNEATWCYFDPEHPSQLYNFYAPKPWAIRKCEWDVQINMEVVLEKREEGEVG